MFGIMVGMSISDAALLVIDVQKGFDTDDWGQRNNPDCETNITRLIGAWRRRGRPVVYVRHDSETPGSPLQLGKVGNEYKDALSGEPDLHIRKSVRSAFYGTPDLKGWLDERQISALAITGITTNHCCETTARMAGDLGFDTYFVLDATHTFDRQHPDGHALSAQTLAEATAASLHGEFATVLNTDDVLGLLDG